MSQKTDRYVATFIKLTAEEQKKVLEDILDFQRSSDTEKKSLQENFSKKAAFGMDLGPLNSGPCPVCGRK